MLARSRLRVFCLVLIACFGAVLASPAAAQTISVTGNAGNIPANFVGQSFTATVSGTVTQIRVIASVVNVTNVRFYDGTGTGVFNAAGAPLYSQAVTLTNSAPAFQTITLTTPLPVTAGSVYSFSFDAAVLRGAGDTYAGGVVFTDGNQLQNGLDLAFEVVQVPAASVPSLSEWALILLGVVLAGGAAIYIQKRQLAA